MGWEEGERKLVFYVYDRLIAGRYHIWLQYALMVTVEIFRRVRMKTNLDKTKDLVCTPG